MTDAEKKISPELDWFLSSHEVLLREKSDPLTPIIVTFLVPASSMLMTPGQLDELKGNVIKEGGYVYKLDQNKLRIHMLAPRNLITMVAVAKGVAGVSLDLDYWKVGYSAKIPQKLYNRIVPFRLNIGNS
jgi:hypothetical protein